jgi:monovalent cation:H+ antiporter-2, CPA2 family
VIARARDASHASLLYKMGVSVVVPETVEASLQLSEAALISLGVPTGLAIAITHDKRDELTRDLQARYVKSQNPSPE